MIRYAIDALLIWDTKLFIGIDFELISSNTTFNFKVVLKVSSI